MSDEHFMVHWLVGAALLTIIGGGVIAAWYFAQNPLEAGATALISVVVLGVPYLAGRALDLVYEWWTE